ncbi:MAG: hypothetical protein U0353_32205 [Sandaracinus sp.]
MRAAAERQRKIEAALNEMPKVARTHERATQQTRNAAKKGKSFDDDGPRVSTTDPSSRMKMGDGGFRPAYNVQYATDTESRVIVGVAVTNVGSIEARWCRC